jgi:hypothetical protein
MFLLIAIVIKLDIPPGLWLTKLSPEVLLAYLVEVL